MKRPTKKQIDTELATLRDMAPRIRQRDEFGGNNRAGIDAQIVIIEKATNPRYILAASYRRLASVLRIHAINYRKAAQQRYWHFQSKRRTLKLRAQVATDLAHEPGNEAFRAEGK